MTGSPEPFFGRKPSWVFVGAVLLAVLQALAYGISFQHWKGYGFSDWRVIPELASLDPIHSIWVAKMTFSRKLFDSFAVPIYNHSLGFILGSILLRALQWIVGFAAMRAITRRDETAFLATLAFAFAMGLTGVNQMGLWGAPVFMAGAFAVVPILIGAALLFRERFLAASLVLGAACHFHAIYSLSSAVPLLLGAGAWIATRKPVQKSDLAKLFIPFGLLILPLLGGLPGGELAANEVSFRQWLSFLMVRDPDDVAMLYSFGAFAPAFTVGAFSLAAFRTKEPWNLAHFVLAAVFAFAGACALLELCHLAGISFGPLTKVFIPSQFRRGVWVAGLCLIPLWIQALESGFSVKRAGFLGAAAVALMAAQVRYPYFFIGLGASSFLAAYLWRDRPKLAAASFASFLAAGSLDFLLGTEAPALHAFGGKILAIGGITLGAAGVLFLRKDVSRRLALWVLVLLPPAAGLADALRGNRFVSGLRLVEKRFPGRVDYPFLIEVEEKRRSAKDFNFESWEESRHWREALEALAEPAREKGRLLADPTYRINPRWFSRQPIYFYELDDRSMSLYSRRFAGNYDLRLKEIFGKGLDFFYSDSNFYERLSAAFSAIEPDTLRRFAAEGRARYILTKRRYSGFEKLAESGRFAVYDLAP